jgi:deoxycytidine triphosphate deaminase
MSIKSDRWIRRMAAAHGLIEPFSPEQVRVSNGHKIVSYGTSSYGYDVRCADEFKIFTNINSTIVDPKGFDEKSFVDFKGDVCIIPPNSFALARTVEFFRIPRSVLVVTVGKSTYARCFRGDTRVALVDGTSPTLEEMARRHASGELFWGYSIGQNGRLIVSLLDAPRFIGRDSLIELELDNSDRIHATPDHFFMRRDGRMAAASALRPGDALMPLYRDLVRGYESVYQPIDGYLCATHRLADEWNLRHEIYADIPQATLRRFTDPLERVRHSRSVTNAWAADKGQRRSSQAEVARRIRLRPEISEDVVRRALDDTGSIRGAAAALNCDRSVFRRFPDVLSKFRGTPVYRNHKVTGVRELAGDHDVYCLTVPEAGNFALEAGVFVKNCGIICNVTPLEPEWEGHVTLEFSNTTPLPAKIYANEGVAQMLFFESDEVCETSYRDRGGKYQGQRGVTLPKT